MSISTRPLAPNDGGEEDDEDNEAAAAKDKEEEEEELEIIYCKKPPSPIGLQGIILGSCESR